MHRRDLLKYIATGLAYANSPLAVALEAKQKPILILIELMGANDGLNTLIPYSDPLYQQLRPRLAIPRDNILQLNDTMGLHPSCEGFLELWGWGELALIQGLGYPNPNRSHFRSIEIWETGSSADEFIQEGWLSEYLNRATLDYSSSVSALALGQDAGPLAGATEQTLVLTNLNKYLRQVKLLSALEKQTDNDSLRHILSVQNSMLQAAQNITTSVSQNKSGEWLMPSSQLGLQLADVAGLIDAQVGINVYKLGLGNFDTHASQISKHAALLKQLSDAVTAFRHAMVDAGHWNNILIMTYSEFGRRAQENGNRGTDHGTAAVQFVAGGKVKGGFYGKQPSLSDLENNDLKYTVDFRSLYRTIQTQWLGVSSTSNRLSRFAPLDFIKT